MKVRTDFVTNSSSSSFVLAFKDEVDLNAFYEHCSFMDYEEISDLVRKILEHNSQEEMRESADGLLYWCYACDKRKEVLAEMMKDKTFETLNEKYAAEQELETSEEFKEAVKERVAKTNHGAKQKKLDDCEIVCEATIWDTDGGLLEWAIRRGILKWECNEWFICQHDVG